VNIILVLVLLLVIPFQYLLHKFLIIAVSQKITFEYILNSQRKYVAIGLQLSGERQKLGISPRLLYEKKAFV
jgi:hypothetical protein